MRACKITAGILAVIFLCSQVLIPLFLSSDSGSYKNLKAERQDGNTCSLLFSEQEDGEDGSFGSPDLNFTKIFGDYFLNGQLKFDLKANSQKSFFEGAASVKKSCKLFIRNCVYRI